MARIAFSTLGCPDWTWFDVLRHGRDYGFDGVEIRLLAREVDLLKIAEFRSSSLAQRRRELRDAGFAVCGLASSVRFDYPDPRQIGEQIEIGKAYVDLAGELKASFVRVFGDVLPANTDADARRDALARIAAGLDRLGEYAQSRAIDILLETHGDFSISRNVRDMMAMTHCPAVGVLWDTHHPWRFCNESITHTFTEIGRWVRHTHWKDSVASDCAFSATDAAASAAAQQAHALMSGHRHANYVQFGQGEFPAVETLRALVAAGYHGWFSLEWEKMWHPELDGPEQIFPLFTNRFREMHAAVVQELAGAGSREYRDSGKK